MSNILSEINRVREIMGIIKEQSNDETDTSWRMYDDIDAARVDKFSLKAIKAGEAEILKNGEKIQITTKIDNVTYIIKGVRAEGNKLIIYAEIDTGRIIPNIPGNKPMGEFVLDETTNKYKFVPNPDMEGKLTGEDKLDFDAFVAAVEVDRDFANNLLTAVMEGADFIPSEHGYSQSTSGDAGDDASTDAGADAGAVDVDVIPPSEEILAWAAIEISNYEGLDNSIYDDDINQLKTDPVAVLKAELEEYKEWNVEEGEEGDWQPEIDVLETLLATLSSEVELPLGKIDGVVTDTKTGLEIPNAKVTITDQDGNTQVVITDENGSYTVENVDTNKNYTISIKNDAGEDLYKTEALSEDFVDGTIIRDLDGDETIIQSYSEETSGTVISGCIDSTAGINPDIDGNDSTGKPCESPCDKGYKATNYNPKATIDDGKCKFVEAYKEDPEKNIKNLKSSLKKKWKKEVFAILDNIKTGDIFGFKDVYDKQESDKLYALLTMIQNLMCVNGKIARALILAQDNVYNPKKLMTIAQFQKGEGVEGLISTIEENIDLLDKRFKWFTGGFKVDAKLSPVKDQLTRARKFINAIEPYLNWGDVENKLGFKAKTTEELLLKMTNKEDMIKTCANQVV